MINSFYLMCLILILSAVAGIILLIEGIECRSVAETMTGMLIIILDVWILNL